MPIRKNKWTITSFMCIYWHNIVIVCNDFILSLPTLFARKNSYLMRNKNKCKSQIKYESKKVFVLAKILFIYLVLKPIFINIVHGIFMDSASGRNRIQYKYFFAFKRFVIRDELNSFNFCNKCVCQKISIELWWIIVAQCSKQSVDGVYACLYCVYKQNIKTFHWWFKIPL